MADVPDRSGGRVVFSTQVRAAGVALWLAALVGQVIGIAMLKVHRLAPNVR